MAKLVEEITRHGFIVPDNQRIEWSPITNTEILRPNDLLKYLGNRGVEADIAVLDSHDPAKEAAA